ncbi:MAG TPA: DUF188 domain-containing protein [Spirochaetia bacterium]|nr:DUF188 domain-containing protein [Spirochaetia bacterium]
MSAEPAPTFRIWVDADSCPTRIREIVCRAAKRTGLFAIFVANRKIPLPAGKQISMVVVGPEEGSADRYIAGNAREGDVAVTRDIPHAADLVERGVLVLNDRGTVYSAENVRERLSVRDFMHDLRNSGVDVPERGRFSQRDIALFSQAFDRELTARLRRRAADQTG